MATVCPKCDHERQPADTAPDYECPQCGVVYAKARKQVDAKIVREQTLARERTDFLSETALKNAPSRHESTSPPFLALVFILLALLGLSGGVVLCGKLWPGIPPEGMHWKVLAYLPSITWLSIGVIEAALFAAIAQGLTYLRGIFENGRRA